MSSSLTSTSTTNNDDCGHLVHGVAAVLQARRNNELVIENAELRAHRTASLLVEVVAHASGLVLATGSLEGVEPSTGDLLPGSMCVPLTMTGATCRLQDLDKLRVRIGGILIGDPLQSDQESAVHVEPNCMSTPDERVIFKAWTTALMLSTIIDFPNAHESRLYPIAINGRRMEIDGLFLSIEPKPGFGPDRDVLQGFSLCIGDEDVEMVTLRCMMFASSLGGDRPPVLSHRHLRAMNQMQEDEED